MKRVLITGKGGFIGGWLEKTLRESGGFETARLSVRGDGWTNEDFSRYDAVVHCAGLAHVDSGSSDQPYDQVNHILTARLAEKAKTAGVGQFVYLSSMIVFGAAAPVGQRRLIGPDTPPAPVNAYGQSKLDAERDLAKLRDARFRVAVLRPPMVYGPGCRGNYNALRKLALKLPVFPAPDNRRSTLYVGSLCELIRQLLAEGGGGLFHPQDGEPCTTAEIAQAIARAHGRKLRAARWAAPLVKLADFGMVRRAFGDMAYWPELSACRFEYRLCGMAGGVAATEAGWEGAGT